MAIRFIFASLALALAALFPLREALAQPVNTCPSSIPPGVQATFPGCFPAIGVPVSAGDGIVLYQGSQTLINRLVGVNQLFSNIATPLNVTTGTVLGLDNSGGGGPQLKLTSNGTTATLSGGAFAVTGATTLSSTLGVTGATTFTGSVTLNNATNFVPNASTLIVTGSNGSFAVKNGGSGNIVSFIDRASGGTPNVGLNMSNGGPAQPFVLSTTGSGTDRSIQINPAGAGTIGVQGQFVANTIQGNGGGSGIVWSGSTIPASFMALSSSAGISGTTTATGSIYENSFAIPSDTLHTPLNGNAYGWGFANNGATGYLGNRGAAQFLFTQTGKSGNKVAGQGVSVIAGVNLGATATTSEGGTGTGLGTGYGQLFGENVVATLSNGATNWQEVHASEFDMNTNTGSSYYRKSIIQIIGGGGETVKGGSGNDIMVLLAQQETGGGASPSATYDTGLQFGDNLGSWPFATTAALISAHEPQNPLSSPTRQAIAGYGVDWGYTEFNTAAWRSMGAKVDGSGNGTLQGLTLGNWSLGLTSGSLQITSSNQETTSISLHAAGGGSGWAAGDKFTWGATGVGKVTTTSGGAATAVSQLVPDAEASPCTSACATTATNNTDGHTGGTGLTVDAVAAGPGSVILGTGAALATNATTGFVQVPTMAGSPSGTVGAAGKAAMVIDTTNKKLCYSVGGGTWECSAAFTP